jgi:transposase-like protein
MSNEVEVLDPLLTEDGHPIGEIVISDGESVPAEVSEETVARNREQVLRAEAAEILGDVDADSALAELYPEYGNGDKRKAAVAMYIENGASIKEIAEKLNVPARTVSMWAYNGGWDRLVRREVLALQSQNLLDLARIRNEKRNAIAREQLDQARMIREKAIEGIKSEQVTLRSGTEAWAMASRIEHTLAGMSEAGSIANVDGVETCKKEKDENEKKQPLVVVFQGGALPPRRSGT